MKPRPTYSLDHVHVLVADRELAAGREEAAPQSPFSPKGSAVLQNTVGSPEQARLVPASGKAAKMRDAVNRPVLRGQKGTLFFFLPPPPRVVAASLRRPLSSGPFGYLGLPPRSWSARGG